MRGEGTDSILRDDEGRYYFARHREPEHGGFSAVHRVNINAVLLYATSLFRDQVTMRSDAADCLMAHRSYDDPFPLSMNWVERRITLRTPRRGRKGRSSDLALLAAAAPAERKGGH